MICCWVLKDVGVEGEEICEVVMVGGLICVLFVCE